MIKSHAPLVIYDYRIKRLKVVFKLSKKTVHTLNLNTAKGGRKAFHGYLGGSLNCHQSYSKISEPVGIPQGRLRNLHFFERKKGCF